MKKLALFDFDGTLYDKDSLIEFTKFSKGNFAFYMGMLFLLPYLMGLKLGILNNEKVKIKFIIHFFKDLELEQFISLGKEFALEKMGQDLSKKIFSLFLNHIKSNDVVYIVSASFPEWIEPWSKQFDVKVIGTKMEVKEGKITGKLASKNCYGNEKVNRICDIINLDEFEEVYVYGSGKGDYEMLQLSKNNK